MVVPRHFRGDYPGAARDADAALLRLAQHPEREADRGAALAISANALRTLGNYDAANNAYTESIRWRRRVRPPPSPAV
jgi:GT2 family glycosyltransferase